ncbi:hypothetical protein I6A81_29605, partial [Frankia sp. CN7]
MAGTLIFSISATHVFQRKFDTESLAIALGDCHWYIITRRPSVRIARESVDLRDEIITLDVVTRESIAGPPKTYHLGADLAGIDETRHFAVHADGAYFSLQARNGLIHGDSWALASLLSGASAELARQEVLYIGQAFGHGNVNAWARTSQHRKLQRIYEDHWDSGWDIYVAPLRLDESAWESDDHIEDLEPGPSFEGYYSSFISMDRELRKPAVDLIEHAL